MSYMNFVVFFIERLVDILKNIDNECFMDIRVYLFLCLWNMEEISKKEYRNKYSMDLRADFLPSPKFLINIYGQQVLYGYRGLFPQALK